MGTITRINPGSMPYFELHAFLKQELPKCEKILEPWLKKQSLNMIVAQRGTGKSFFVLSMALAVIYGGEFLGWQVTSPQGVLYIDGEMSANILQERLQLLTRSFSSASLPFYIANIDTLGEYKHLLKLSDKKVQQEFIKRIPTDCNLIVFDNISCLWGDIDENDATAWHPIQTWLIYLRSLGYTIILVHHTNKNGSQRGTSKREDSLDTVLKLTPCNLPNITGATFQIEFTKSRAISSEHAKSLVAGLCSKTGVWTWMLPEMAENQRLVELYNAGNSQTEIAQKLSISQPSVSRKINLLKKEGLIE